MQYVVEVSKVEVFDVPVEADTESEALDKAENAVLEPGMRLQEYVLARHAYLVDPVPT